MSTGPDIALTKGGEPVEHGVVNEFTPVTKATVTVEHDNGVIVELVFNAEKLGPLLASWTQSQSEGLREWAIYVEQRR